MTIGEYMRAQRTAREMSIREIARECEVSHGAILRLEESKRMSARTFARYLQAVRADEEITRRALDLVSR